MMKPTIDFAQTLAALADLSTEQQVQVIEDSVAVSDLAKEAPLMALLVMDFDTNHLGSKLAPVLEVRMEAVRGKIREAVLTHVPPSEITDQ